MKNSSAFWLTSIEKRIVFDRNNNLSNIFGLHNSFDHNEVYDNEWDLYLQGKNITLVSDFDEDVYDYLKNLLTGSNSFTILEELKKKGVI
jgi:hypothetical protein